MLEFMKADPTVNHIELDGHSDNSGNRLTNRDLSRRRALAVMDFFKANGIQESQITLRFHGERYPLAPNTNAANRASNRRVNVQLERVAPAEQAGAAGQLRQQHRGNFLTRRSSSRSRQNLSLRRHKLSRLCKLSRLSGRLHGFPYNPVE